MSRDRPVTRTPARTTPPPTTPGASASERRFERTAVARVAVIFTGGTISMVANADAGGKVPTLDGAAILARAPGIERIADLEVIDMGRTPASHFSFEKLFEI